MVVRSPGDRDPIEPRRRLARADQNRTFFGVAAGIGRRYGLDPTLVRIGFVLWALAGGLGLLVYIGLAIFLPADEEPIGEVGHPIPDEQRYGLILLLVAIATFATWRGSELLWDEGPRILFWPSLALSVLLAIVALVARWGVVPSRETWLGRALAAVTLGALLGAGSVALFTAALLATATGSWWLPAVALALLLIWLLLRAPTGRGLWLAPPIAVIIAGVAVALIAGLDFEGRSGERTVGEGPRAISERPVEISVGSIVFDLTRERWRPRDRPRLDLTVGAGEAVIVVPESVCLWGSVRADVGELRLLGSRSRGFGIERSLGSPPTGDGPALELDVAITLGTVVVVNRRRFDPYRDGGATRGSTRVNDRACAGA